MEIFSYLNGSFASVSDAESHHIENLTEFPGNPILEILIEIYKCVGKTHLLGFFP